MRLDIKILFGLLLTLSLNGYADEDTSQKIADKPADRKSGNAEQTLENPYSKSYVSRGRPTVALQPDTTGPKIYRGKDEVSDYQRMLENGFDMLGYSSFQGLDVPPARAIEQAQKLKADLVLVYAKQKGSRPVSVQIDQMRKKAQDQKAPTGSDVSSSPQNQALYEYFASYWVKLAPPLIGVHVETYNEEDSKPGLRVIAVVKESPAAKAAIQGGDVLTRIGDVELSKPEMLTQAAQRYAGQTVEVLYQRGNDDAKTVMTLNSR